MVGPNKNSLNKVYVIDPGSANTAAERPGSGKPVNVGEDGKELPKYLQPSKKTKQKSRRTPRSRKKTQTGTQPETKMSAPMQTRAPSRKKSGQSGFSLVFSYLAGPLSVLTVGRGRESRLWIAISLSSVILGIIAFCMWIGLSDWSTQKNPAGVAALLVAVAAVIAWFSAWTKGIRLIRQYGSPRMKRMPDWIRGPLAAGLLGMAFPGMGLFINGRSRQAVAVLWMVCMTIISLLLLSKAFWLWNFNLHAGAFAVRPDTLEYALISSGVIVALGGLVWIVQALNGVRLASLASSRKMVYRSNWASAALLFSVIAFSILSKPAEIAEALDIGAAITRGEGMKIIPLKFSLAAIRFDPARPGYFVRAIGLYEDCGDSSAAEDMRRELIDRLMPSVPLLEKEGIIAARAGAPAGTLAGSLVPVDVSLDSAPIGDMFDHGPQPGAMPAELLTLDWNMNRVKP
ncbi:MAG: hypothetical protein JW746_09825 [Candidatus Krumholzibacteriota bacterium]|nr:hypothetical protein [Candidatus Krumholzibacteriota bacterium]